VEEEDSLVNNLPKFNVFQTVLNVIPAIITVHFA
jgi:hypothetical protein